MIIEAETRVKSKSLSNKLQYLYASVASLPQKTVHAIWKIIWSLARYQTGRFQHVLMGNSDSPHETDVYELVGFSSAMVIQVN
jgi:hypothetical protein